MLLLLSIIQFLSYGQLHWLVSICTIFQWFTCYENSQYQWFMSNLCYIVYIDLSIMAFGSQTTTNDSCLIHIIFDWNDGPIVGSPFNFVI